VLIPSTYVLRAYNNARHRTKQRAYVPSLAGCTRIPFNHSVIDIAHQIRQYEDRVYTYCMSTGVHRYLLRA